MLVVAVGDLTCLSRQAAQDDALFRCERVELIYAVVTTGYDGATGQYCSDEVLQWLLLKQVHLGDPSSNAH